MEQDNVKWKYNKEKHEVQEKPTMEFKFSSDFGDNYIGYNKYLEDIKNHIASLRSLPVHGKVDWKDVEDVTGKFNIREPNYLGDEYQPEVAIPIKQEQPQSYTDKDFANYIESLNQSQEQDNVKGGEFGDAYFKVKKIVAHAWRSAANAYLMYPNNKHTFFDYWSDLGKDFSKELQIQITSLEASNNFHKQQAHEAIKELKNAFREGYKYYRSFSNKAVYDEYAEEAMEKGFEQFCKSIQTND